MGTTADKLAYLNGTKTAIKNAIVAKGVAVPHGTTFRAYADKISSIQDVSSLPTQGAKTVTPTTTEQIAVASGTYTTGDIKVAGDANLVAENIAEGVSIFGVQGAFAGGGIEQANVSISNYIIGNTYITYLTSELQPSTATIGYEEKSYTCAKNTFIIVRTGPDTPMDKYTIKATGANLIQKYSGSAGSEVLVFYINSNNCTLTAKTSETGCVP